MRYRCCLVYLHVGLLNLSQIKILLKKNVSLSLLTGRIPLGYRGACKEKSKNLFNMIEVKYLNHLSFFPLTGLWFFSRNNDFNRFKKSKRPFLRSVQTSNCQTANFLLPLPITSQSYYNINISQSSFVPCTINCV